MSYKLLFVTSRYFYQPTLDALHRMMLPWETKVVSYSDFSEIPAVFLEYSKDFDVCFVTGSSAKAAIEMAVPNITIPLVHFQVDSDGLHRNILQLAVEQQSLDFSRIVMDFMIPMGSGCCVTDYLALEDMSQVWKMTNQWMLSPHESGNETVDVYIIRKLQSLWQQKAFDLVICEYSSIIPALEALGIPYRCPFISDSQLRRSIEETLLRLELNRHHNNHPAIVQIFPRHPHAKEEIAVLRDALNRFLRDNLLECVLQESHNCCILITTMQMLRFLTDEFQICRISSWLEQALAFPVAVAYGVGTNISHAMNNVQIASKEASLLGKPFLVDTNGNLIGPLNSQTRMVITYRSMSDAGEIARRCSLSAMTIQKLMAIVESNGTNKITTQELAKKLDTTVRNANRILLHLCQGNAARSVYSQTSHSRGRPIQVYELDFTKQKN